jgi:hypothetical protein
MIRSYLKVKVIIYLAQRVNHQAGKLQLIGPSNCDKSSILRQVDNHLCLLAIALVCLLGLLTSTTAAQLPKRNMLPRVGTIKNYELRHAVPDGCNNHSVRWHEDAVTDIYLSNADGSNALMNLDGRDVPLTLVKTTLYYRDQYGTALAYHEYRAGATRITVSFMQLSDYTSFYQAKIVLRRGHTARTIRAVGAPQCD